MIRIAVSDRDVQTTFDVMRQLRPQLTPDTYVTTIRRLMNNDNFHLAYLAEGHLVTAVAGYRFTEMLYCGKLLSVDDLFVDENARSRGHGAQLLDWLAEEGRRAGCKELQLISRVQREQAHRFYFSRGMAIDCFHFRLTL
jgi:GNAT superfamily N-acetyltransferase